MLKKLFLSLERLLCFTHLFGRQRLVQHLHVGVLREVVELAQVGDYSLQVLQKLFGEGEIKPRC